MEGGGYDDGNDDGFNAGRSEVSTHLAAAFVHLTLDINLTLKTAAVLELHRDYLTIKLNLLMTASVSVSYIHMLISTSLKKGVKKFLYLSLLYLNDCDRCVY